MAYETLAQLEEKHKELKEKTDAPTFAAFVSGEYFLQALNKFTYSDEQGQKVEEELLQKATDAGISHDLVRIANSEGIRHMDFFARVLSVAVERPDLARTFLKFHFMGHDEHQNAQSADIQLLLLELVTYQGEMISEVLERPEIKKAFGEVSNLLSAIQNK